MNEVGRNNERQKIEKALSLIDDTYVGEAAVYAAKDKDKGRLRWAAFIAASFAAVAIALPILAKTGVINIGVTPSHGKKSDSIVALSVAKISASSPTTDVYKDSEYEPWTEIGEQMTDENAPKDETVEFDGESYDGTYSYTERPRFSPYRTRVYKFERENGVRGYFSVNEKTGELDDIVFVRDESATVNSATLQSCEKDAARIADQYLDKLRYKSEMTAGPHKRFVVTFYTTDTIYDIEYLTSIVIMYNGQGEIVRFTKNSVGAIDASDSEDIEALIGDDGKAAADKKIKDMFGDALVWSEVKERGAVPLEEGGVGVVYIYDVSVEVDASDRDAPYTDSLNVEILVKFE